MQREIDHTAVLDVEFTGVGTPPKDGASESITGFQALTQFRWAPTRKAMSSSTGPHGSGAAVLAICARRAR